MQISKTPYIFTLTATVLLCYLCTTNHLWASPNNDNKPKQELPYSFKHPKQLKAKVVAEIIDPQAVYDDFMKTVNANFKEISRYLGNWEKNYKRSLTNSGTWQELPNGDRLWRLKITTQSNLITGIGVHGSNKMNIPEGGKLFFYSDDKKYVVGPVTKPNYEGSKQLLVNTIPGKTIWVEYYEPKAHKGKSIFNIDALLYRFVDFPYGITHKLKQKVPFMNPFKPAYEDLIREELKATGPKLGEIRGGSTGGIRIPLLDKGVWIELPNGDRIWRMGFESTIAYGMEIIVLMDMPKQCYISFYSADGQYVSSIYHEPSNANDGNFSTGNMPGDKYIIEYYEPKEFRNKGKLKLHSINTDLTKTVADKGDRSVQPSEVACSPNVSCDCDDFEYRTDTLDAFCGTNLWTMVDTLKRAVVKYQIFLPCSNPADPGCIPSNDDPTVFVYNALAKYYGTGALINNPQLEPYILSAHHCIKQVGVWGTHVIPHTVGDKIHYRFDFGFETTCNSFLAADLISSDPILTGATAIAGNKIGDFLLLKLHETPLSTLHPYYAGWDAYTKQLPAQGLSISHPYGYDKRYALQDDAINLIPGNPNNGIKPFSTTDQHYLWQVTEKIDGETFALTFDRGATTPGSSGSPYFNPNGQIIGDLSGASVACAANDTVSYLPNGNNNEIEAYGRMWYYYDKYHELPDVYGGPLINVSTDGGIDSIERLKTLKYWLQDLDNPDSDPIMDGLSATNCEIYMRDNPWDTPNNEPNNTALIDNAWQDVWSSPDLWNTTLLQSIIVNDANAGTLLSETNQEPDFRDEDLHALNNFLRFRIHNGGSCASKPASLHLYWTMASTGEAWPNDWIDHRAGTDPANVSGSACLIGDEITTQPDGFGGQLPYPYPIASIPPYGTAGYWQKWSPPNFTDPNAPYYINPIGCVDDLNVRKLDVDAQNSKFEICLLARLQSLDNPIFGVETANTTQNVLNSNNIVTRNTFLADPTVVGMAPPIGGGDGGIITHIGTPSIILVANNNDYVKNLDVTLDKISLGSTEALDQLMQIDLIPGDELWQKWQSTGFKGEGIQIIADKVIRVTNMETAKLLDIPFNAKEFEPLKIKVTILSYSGKAAPTQQIPNNYTFKVSHRSSDPAVSINPPTDCIFNVTDLQKYGQAPTTETTVLPTNATLNCYPNPFSNQLSFVVQTFAATNISLALYDLQGKWLNTIIQNQQLAADQYTFTLNASDLPKGMYIARLIAGNNTVVKKVIKW